MEKVGFTIGKFAPLHKGHQFLIEKGLSQMDKFYIVVYETNKLNIDFETRAKWIKELYPQAEIIYAPNPPSKYGLDEESVNIQMDYLSKIVENIHPTHFFSSEDYGSHVAKYLNIENVVVDKNRENNPISSSLIRENFKENINWLEPNVYKDFKVYYNS